MKLHRKVLAKRELVNKMVIVLCALGLSACASLSPEQCKSANWRQIGFADGVNGLSAARINEHAEACAEYGVRPNLQEYVSGRSQGLLNYCQAENGFALGRSGSQSNVADCPENLKPEFKEQYHRGSQIYGLENEMRNYRSRIDNARNQIRRDNDRIAEVRAALSKKDLPGDKRAGLLSEFERLVERREGAQRDIPYMEIELERLERRTRSKMHEFGR